MNNLSALSSFTEMQVLDRDGLRRRVDLKRFREDRDNEQAEALIGAEGDRETEKYMIARHYGITVEQLRGIEEGGERGDRAAVPPTVAPTYVFKDDTDKRKLQQELAEAKGELLDERFFVGLTLRMLDDLIFKLNTKGMAQQELERKLEAVRDTLNATGEQRKSDQSKVAPQVVEEN